MLKKGLLIERLSKPTFVYTPTVVKNDLGGNQKTMVLGKSIPMYITSIENSGNREVVVEEYAATRKYLGQTTEKETGIKINDILKQGELSYRVLEIDEDAANVAIEAEYTLQRISDLQDKQL